MCVCQTSAITQYLATMAQATTRKLRTTSGTQASQGNTVKQVKQGQLPRLIISMTNEGKGNKRTHSNEVDLPL